MSRINGFVGRRNFLKQSIAGVGGLAVGSGMQWITQQTFADASPANPNPVNSDKALKRLLDGNKRFVDQKRKYPDQSLEHLRLVAKGQYPFASIFGCADSRVPAEIVFDQGLGDLFVVRVAGNVVSDMAIGSLEYSTAILGCQLIVVLGHRKCGAVMEALEEQPAPGRISLIVEGIKPAVEEIKLKTGNIQENAIVANIQYQAKKLQESSTILAKLIRKGQLKIVGACYDIDTGKVSIVA
ncbi:carbonic anhydrase [Brasilonema sp. UFV-L1]|uniref:carbonic anhydrase n=1 Tax=Brasilonema sp. UFV-L1 TaxID=2234130 RepID=UPI00145CCD72|nr:carbonic anhydrase [Brasilonema sp. UFV-L1]NMG06216.1 carbonic anhydrase [Brasilonema sp. UFV-L1]